MFSKTIALFAVFAVIAPVLAAPLPGDIVKVVAKVENVANNLDLSVASTGPKAKRGSVADVFVDVENDVENLDAKVASTSRKAKRGNVIDAAVGVKNTLNHADVNVLSTHKRGNVVNAVVAVKDTLNNADVSVLSAGKSKRGYWDGCSVADITAVVQDVADDMHINILSSRDSCDVVGLKVIMQDVLDNLDVNVLSSKGSNTLNFNDLVAAIQSVLSGVSGSQKRDELPAKPNLKDLIAKFKAASAKKE